MEPSLSGHFVTRKPSAIRAAQIKYLQRKDKVKAINTAIGNVSLPMHPAMQQRMFNLDSPESPFQAGVVKYSATVGEAETNHAVLHIIAASGFKTNQLFSQITDGGSQAMELVILGTCGDAGSEDRPLLLIDAAYTNYASMCQRLGRKFVSVTRTLHDNGRFSLPDMADIDRMMAAHKPGALVVIPYDNPTGQFMNQAILSQLACLCVKHNVWMVSDEAYREMQYTQEPTSSIWGLTEEMAPGITGRRISIESASKVWNACGLRIGAVVTDNHKYHQQSVAENTANLCSNVIGQYIFGALAHQSQTELRSWFQTQRDYYQRMISEVNQSLLATMTDIIVSCPEASLYTVVDVRKIVPIDFNAADFVDYCASTGKVKINGEDHTLLVSPMDGFYKFPNDSQNPGRTQMRIAFVESPEKMKLVPELFKKLLQNYLELV